MKSAGIGALFIASLVIGLVWVMSLWTDRNLDFWFSYFRNENVDIPMWLSVILTIIGNGVVILANVVAELAKFAV